ncbi:Uncharacterized protein BP5553_02704 [Venustampulla echinocandica]|uniref:Cellobiose dehydrogenase-like cytochrome domain-containing protein n=1 Tax=Venustampulla echinocandica TaxID=2656787 RepID=A0A370TS84_9HELO|nr:Uncharacterized protein BP5553_02704 [Venustampulla echinocandica]RDL38364.1 Uncharacterized protein BP5553_02704 [Venustampulla echinocandica]
MIALSFLPYLRVLFFLPSLTLAASATTSTFTDTDTGITFQRFFGAKTQFGFGIALPENPTTDFIGQMDFPTPANAGWGGISLADEMVGPLLLVAWPTGNNVTSSFRLAKNEDDSPPVTTGSFAVSPIPQGTSANGTHMKFTFLCQNCIDGKLGFAAGDTNSAGFEMGWALASKAVKNAADPATTLPFHNSGFETFQAQLNLARSASFGEWAAMAGVAASNGSTTPVAAAAPGSASASSFGGGDDDDDDDDDDDSDDDD